MRSRIFWCLTLSALFLCSCAQEEKSFNIPPNTWIKIFRDEEGARRHSSFRYVENEGYFLLWGYLGYNVYIRGGPHAPYEENPEYDIVVFDPKVGRWRNQFPFEKEQEWSRKLPPVS